jgi:hypothetical protein
MFTRMPWARMYGKARIERNGLPWEPGGLLRLRRALRRKVVGVNFAAEVPRARQEERDVDAAQRVVNGRYEECVPRKEEAR